MSNNQFVLNWTHWLQKVINSYTWNETEIIVVNVKA